MDNRLVQFCLSIVDWCIFMAGGGVCQYPQYFLLGQDFVVVQRQEKRLADGKRGNSGNIIWQCHYTASNSHRVEFWVATAIGADRNQIRSAMS
jgi:hypothetical protein